MTMNEPGLIADPQRMEHSDVDADERHRRAQSPRTEAAHRVLILHHPPWFGGAEIHVLDWLRGIDYSKHSVWLTDTAGLFSSRLKQLGLPVTCTHVDLPVNKSFWKVFFSWLSYLRRMRPDQIIMIDSYVLEWPLPVVLAASIAARGNVYVTEHVAAPEPPPKTSRVHFGFLPGVGLWWHWSMWKLRARVHLARRTLAVSEHVREWLIRSYRYPPDKVVVAHHGVDTARFCRGTESERKAVRAFYAAPEDAIVIASTARFEPYKRIDRLIEAFDALSVTHPNLWLLLAGNGPLREEMQDLARRSSSTERIKFLGRLEDVAPLLKAADLFALTSDFEGLPLSLLEAMASELICVVTDTQGPREVIEDGDNGFLVELTGKEVLKGLEKALGLSKRDRELVGQSARRTIVGGFEIDAGIKRGLAALDLSSDCDVANK